MSAAPDAFDAAWRAREEGATLLQLSRPQEALEHLHRAASLGPADARTHCLIALAHIELGRHEEALDAAGAAAALDPESEWPHRLRSLSLRELGRAREARDAALEACRRAPAEPLAHVALSGALLATRDEAGALAAAAHAVELDPESAQAHNQLGLVLLAHERAGEAEDAFRAALAIDPESSTALNNLSVAQLRQGDRRQALGGLERAVRLDPGAEHVRRNVLLVGGAAGGFRWWRRLAIACVLFALVAVASGEPTIALFLLIPAAVFELVRRRSLQQIKGPTRDLLLDDVRARRFKPWRWEWSWPARLRPWWWLLLQRLPPPVALVLNAGLLALTVATRLTFFAVLLAAALPFSLRRGWRWWRRSRPASASWRPPQ